MLPLPYGIWTKIVFGQIGDGGPGWPVRSRRVHRPPRHELMLTWLTDRIDTNVLEAAEALARRRLPGELARLSAVHVGASAIHLGLVGACTWTLSTSEKIKVQ
jgi:hypothetical protein